MDVIRGRDQHIDFDDFLLSKRAPRLGPAKDFNLSPEQVAKIFGINGNNFTPIPTRLVVPVLNGHRLEEHRCRTHGWLYVLEPQEWIPVVRRGETVTPSTFPQTYSAQPKDVMEANFNDGCKASVTLQAGGSYYGVSASVKGGRNISFEYCSSTITPEDISNARVASDELLQELLLYPVLRCKAIRRQRIDYAINELTGELIWSEKSSEPVCLERLQVPSSRVGRIKEIQFHPVPVYGREPEDKSRLLPIPHITSSGDFEITTLISRTGWSDWYIYEAEFQDCSKTINLAAPQNDVAFRPARCWTTLSAYAPSPSWGNDNDEESESSDDSDDSIMDGMDEVDEEFIADERTNHFENSNDGGDMVIECALEPLDQGSR